MRRDEGEEWKKEDEVSGNGSGMCHFTSLHVASGSAAHFLLVEEVGKERLRVFT